MREGYSLCKNAGHINKSAINILLPFKFFFAAVLPECRFYIPKVIALAITPRSFTAASPRSYHRKVISHSDGHSVVIFQTFPLDRQRDGLKFKVGYNFSLQVVGIENAKKLSDFSKNTCCKKIPPQVVAIENPEKTTP